MKRMRLRPSYVKKFMRHLMINLIVTERRYLNRIKHSQLLGYLTHSHLFSFEKHALSRGIAIGLFWAFMPMPFQMVPALLFCWLGLANLPIALLCVWISNPFTYLPIFYVEYQVGTLLFHANEHSIMSFSQFSGQYQKLFSSVGDIYITVLQGSLVIGTALSVLGYFAGFPLSNYLLRFTYKRRKR